MQLQNQTGQQALAQTMVQRHNQIMFGLINLPDDQLPGAAKQALDAELATKQIDPQRYAVMSQHMQQMTPAQLRREISAGLVANLGGPEALAALSPKITDTNLGGQQVGRMTPSPLELATNPGAAAVTTIPGAIDRTQAPEYINTGGQVQPVGGALGTPTLGTTATPGELISQQTRDATQADVEAFAKQGIQIKVGQQITQAMIDRLIQQGRSNLISPSQGGAGGGGGQPARTVPPVNAAGQPVGPATPAGLTPAVSPAPSQGQRTMSTAPGGAVVTSAPPNTGKENEQDAQAYGAHLAAAQSFPQENQQYTSALGALRSVRTGPGTETLNHWQSFIQAVSPDIAKKLGINPSDVESFDEAKKYLTNLANGATGQAKTDMQTALGQVSNPSTSISNQAAQKMLAIAQAFRQAKQAGFQEFQRQHPQTGDSQGFNRQMNEYQSKMDYHAFLPMDEAEFKKYYNTLSPTGKKNFVATQQIARDNQMVQ
jgi:hypothetical protein